LGDKFARNGVDTVYAAPNQIGWVNGQPVSLVEGCRGEVGGIVRYFPAEWLCNYKRGWKEYFSAQVPCCNHPVALYTQSKRLPLIWDRLKEMSGQGCMPLQAWKQLLPETVDPRLVDPLDTDWVFKPAMGRVGEGITIKEAITSKEYNNCLKQVRKYPKEWVAQRRFNSVPLVDEQGTQFHLCVGVFTVNGKFAGFYGRVSRSPRVDELAIDIPILVRG
jgi:hypothetical protein